MVRLRLETARELQKFRQRTLGVTAEKLMKSDAEAASKKQEKAAAAVPKGGITYPGGYVHPSCSPAIDTMP